MVPISQNRSLPLNMARGWRRTGRTPSFAPAGHVLGSAQAVLTFQEQTLVAAGDYKRKADPTCAPFEVVPCDVFVTEATRLACLFFAP